MPVKFTVCVVEVFVSAICSGGVCPINSLLVINAVSVVVISTEIRQDHLRRRAPQDYRRVRVVACCPAAQPPPKTATQFTCGEPASSDTSTVIGIAAEKARAASTSLRVQTLLSAAHVLFVPAIESSVNPDGIVSVTVTVPFVGPAPAVFDTVTV